MPVLYQKFRPSAPLRPFVRFYYAIRSDAATSYTVENHPQGGVDLVLALRGSTRFQHAKLAPVDLSGVFVLPLQEQPFVTTFGPHLHHVGIAFVAEGFSQFFRLPVGELANRGEMVSHEIDRPLRQLHDRLAGQPDDATRAACIDRFLLSRFGENAGPDARFFDLAAHIRRSGGTVPVRELAVRSGACSRTIQRWSKSTLGLSAKRYSRIVRFNTALRHLRQRPEAGWLDVALQLGYYDQSHFISEFRQFTGQTPTGFFGAQRPLSEFHSGDRSTLELGTVRVDI